MFSNKSNIVAINSLTKSMMNLAQQGSGTALVGAIGNTNYQNKGLVKAGYEFAPADVPHEYARSYQVIEVNEDLLALSIAWHRIRQLPNYTPIESLISKILFESVTEDDRKLSEEIKKYYSQKIMVLKLKNKNLSKFREDLSFFLHQSNNLHKKEIFPLVYRLPEFYEYDKSFDEFKHIYNRELNVDKDVLINTKISINFIKCFTVGKGANKRKEYWFSDNKNNLVNMTIFNNNPLISLLDNVIKNELNLLAKLTRRHRDDTEFLSLDKYSFL